MPAATAPTIASRLINSVLAIKPLANLAKDRARHMMIKRAESIGVYWTKEVEALRTRNWDADFAQVQNPNLKYPEYYLTSFHAYEEGDLGWEPAFEAEVAARTVHASIWKEAGAEGDSWLRQSYHDVVKSQLPQAPNGILDVGCSIGMSTFALQSLYPNAKVTGLDLSPYFLAVATYKSKVRSQEKDNASLHSPTWLHASAEETGLPDASFDLVSAFLIFHEVPQTTAISIFKEARRLLRPGGHLTIMDMNPKSEIYAKMPPYILTLLKSTEPYMDEYFSLDIEQAIFDAGFDRPTITPNSPRHRTIVAKAR